MLPASGALIVSLTPAEATPAEAAPEEEAATPPASIAVTLTALASVN